MTEHLFTSGSGEHCNTCGVEFEAHVRAVSTHYILADDYDRWNPGEPIEDVASDIGYLKMLFMKDRNSVRIRLWDHLSESYKEDAFIIWLMEQVENGTLVAITTDTEGRILS